MPSLFVGHGDPMNAISDNNFTRQWREIGERLPKARAILSVSAHWETPSTQVSVIAEPETIHDFGGFPEIMYALQYPAAGAPDIATELAASHPGIDVGHWGLDHGTWCVLGQMLPSANIPVFQLSLGRDLSPAQHFALAEQLSELRNRGVIIFGSGNLVHNMYAMADDYRSGRGEVLHPWAQEFDAKMAQLISQGDYRALTEPTKMGELFKLAHPTIEHYLPVLYTLGSGAGQQASFFAEGFEGGSFSMRSILIS